MWRGRKVLVTGHDGFKESWLAVGLASRRASLLGFALAPPTEPNFFRVCRLADYLAGDASGDVRDAGAIDCCPRAIKPEGNFHPAVQPLVRRSCREIDQAWNVGTSAAETRPLGRMVDYLYGLNFSRTQIDAPDTVGNAEMSGTLVREAA